MLIKNLKYCTKPSSWCVLLRNKLSDSPKWKSLKIDRSSLPKLDGSSDYNTSTDSSVASIPKEDISELGKELRSYITQRGPITLHDYVSQSSNHFIHGYYQNKSTKIGVKGDFVS